MADNDVVQSAMTHGLTLLSGGGLAGVFVRMLFGGFGEKLEALGKRLDKMEEALEAREQKTDRRHDELVAAIAEVKLMASSAHTRIDGLGTPRRRR